MKRGNQATLALAPILVLLALFFACATMPYFNVDYRLPPESALLQTHRAYLAIEDRREVKEVLGPGARQDLTDFSGNWSLSVARGTDTGFRVGIFDLEGLLKEGFKRRMAASGLTVVPRTEKDAIGIVVALETFSLDLVNRRWRVRMGYEAALVREGKVLARQVISGEGERLKLFGRREAERAVGDTLTDVLNRLDLGRLFRQAGI
ncbi:MAG: hypothetical protein JW821_12640 [Deltaproteobacteria bacterium]|nr:hypothetical protein [Deltaproteobacteria bacterium]